MFMHNKKGQSILEYAILLGVVIAALLVMQVFVKRGYQGGLKDSAEKMAGGAEAYSLDNTVVSERRTLATDQLISSRVATDEQIAQFLPAGTETDNIVSKQAYSVNLRKGGDSVSETQTVSDAVSQEKTTWADHGTTVQAAIADPF